MTKKKKEEEEKKKQGINKHLTPAAPHTKQTCVNFRNFAGQYLRSLKTYHF